MKKTVFKVIAALMIFVVLFFSLQALLAGDKDHRDSQRIAGFYDRPQNTLDAIFIGSSATYAFWMAPFAWQEYGITVYPYSTRSQTIQAARFIVEEAAKTQPDALFIVNISSTHIENTYAWFHTLFDNMPASSTKYRMIDYICDQEGYTLSERMEYYFPIIRLHDRWYQVRGYDFNRTADAYMSGNSYKKFLTLSEDSTGGYYDSEYRSELPWQFEQSVNDLIDYCQQEGHRLMFTITPQAIFDKEQLGMQNTLIDLVEERGYKVFNMRDHFDDIGLDFTTDYIDPLHTNLHGCIKVTDFFSRHLIENYGFTDKRGDAAYNDWDTAAEAYYTEVIEQYLTETDKAYFRTNHCE